jgi:hypothetical protein
MFYTATVKVMFEDDKGRLKSRKETYLVSAETVTEVEAIVHEDFGRSMQEFQVLKVAKSGILDILNWPEGATKVSKTKVEENEFSSM